MNARAAFTMVELLVVVTIIALLAGLLLAVVPQLQFKAKVAATTSKMNAITGGLAAHSVGGEGAVPSLQRAADLGGVQRFATVRALLNLIPDFVGADGGRGENAHLTIETDGDKLWTKTRNHPPDSWRLVDQHDSTRRSVYLHGMRDVSDCLPNAAADLKKAWYSSGGSLLAWPTRWRQPDWDQETPGSVPPILRFPWGKVGLRLDATPCDPGLDPGVVVPGAVDPLSSNFPPTTDKVTNAWCTMGSDSGSLMTFTAKDLETSSVTGTVQARRSSGETEAIPLNRPLPFDLGHCSPLRSIALLQAAGVLVPGVDGAAAYRSDRNPSRPWNDAWGHPLVVVYALFQPERFYRDGDKWNRRDRFLRASRTVYQYDRELYLSVGAIGPVLESGWGGGGATWSESDDAGAQRRLWRQIRSSTKAWKWTEAAWTGTPPWTGVRVGDLDAPAGRLRGLVSAPVALQ